MQLDETQQHLQRGALERLDDDQVSARSNKIIELLLQRVACHADDQLPVPARADDPGRLDARLCVIGCIVFSVVMS